MPSLFPLQLLYFVAKNFYFYFFVYSFIVSYANIIKYGYIFLFPPFCYMKDSMLALLHESHFFNIGSFRVLFFDIL